MQQPKLVLDPSSSLAPYARPFASRSRARSSKRLTRLVPPAPKSFSDPSSGLLALLVTVAGSSSADGRPSQEKDIPPDFLCPRLHARSRSQPSSSRHSSSFRDPCDAASLSVPSSSSNTPSRSTRPTKKPGRGKNFIADKYEQSEDGRWRKVDSWELYGSSSCAITQCMDAIPTEVQDDQVSGAPATASSTSTNTPAPSLPSGWEKHSGTDAMTGVILALSLSLAVALVLFMVGVVLWRRKRRKAEAKDAEKTATSSDGANAESEGAKLARSQQRRLARASARWMANVRQSARRRKRYTAVAARESETDLLNDRQTPQASATAVSLFRAHAVTDSHVRSTSTIPPSRSSTPITTNRQGDVEVSPSSCTYPPAYLPNATLHRTSPAELYRVGDLSNPHHSSDLPIPSGSRLSPGKSSSPLPYDPLTHIAHVATDDKSVLARMAALASAPPPTDQPPLGRSGGYSEIYPSVPVFEDDGFEPLPPELQSDTDFSANTRQTRGAHRTSSSGLTHDVSPSTLEGPSPYPDPTFRSEPIDQDVPSYAEDAIRHRTLILPPPPLKVTLAGPMFYEYPNEFEEDVITTEPSFGPSSPPFDEPSAPPFDYQDGSQGGHLMVPSAPPLEEEVSSPDACTPSAPPMDREAPLPLHSHSHGTSPDACLPGVEASAPLSNSADQGTVSASEVSSCQFAGHSGPPQYLP